MIPPLSTPPVNSQPPPYHVRPPVIDTSFSSISSLAPESESFKLLDILLAPVDFLVYLFHAIKSWLGWKEPEVAKVIPSPIAPPSSPVIKLSVKTLAEMPITEKEGAAIKFIVETSAKGLASAIPNVIALYNAKDLTHHIHPLRFLQFIFQDPDLKKNFFSIPEKIWDSYFGWNGFKHGLIETLKRSENEIQPYLAEFAKALNASKKEYVHSWLFIASQKNDWLNFVDIIRKNGTC